VQDIPGVQKQKQRQQQAEKSQSVGRQLQPACGNPKNYLQIVKEKKTTPKTETTALISTPEGQRSKKDSQSKGMMHMLPGQHFKVKGKDFKRKEERKRQREKERRRRRWRVRVRN